MKFDGRQKLWKKKPTYGEAIGQVAEHEVHAAARGGGIQGNAKRCRWPADVGGAMLPAHPSTACQQEALASTFCRGKIVFLQLYLHKGPPVRP
jgi:hypothetical protein